MAVYNFNYNLHIDFGGEVKEQTFLLRCLPADNNRQIIKEIALEIQPRAQITHGKDWTGNKTVTGFIAEPHSEFNATVSGMAETYAGFYEESAYLSPIYKYPTPLTKTQGKLEEFAKSLNLNGEPPYDAARKICRAVYDYFTYTKGVTDVETSAAQAFEIGKGVCQDYAHAALALMRYYKIPCRYAAGIICGQGESHAWVEAECNGFIYGFDPTNNLLVSDGYIKFCGGRDAADCAVSRGVFKGIVSQKQTVSAEVNRANEQ